MTVARRCLWIELGLGGACLGLLILTAAWPEWIEEISGIDPDGGNGALEWALVVVLGICTVGFLWHARSGWRAAHDLEPATLGGPASGP